MLTAAHDRGCTASSASSGRRRLRHQTFSLRELTARVRAVLRRGATVQDGRPVGMRDASRGRFSERGGRRGGRPAARLTRANSSCPPLPRAEQNARASRVIGCWNRVWGYERLVETGRSMCTLAGCATSLEKPEGRLNTVVGLGYRFVD